MFDARVTLKRIQAGVVPDSRVDTPDTFWRDLPGPSASLSVDPQRNEERLRTEFPRKLQSYFREKRDFGILRSQLLEAQSSVADLEKSIEPALPKVTVTVRRISYGSIEFFLEIFGLTGESGRQFLEAALMQYAPLAFNETMGTHLPFNTVVALSEVGANMPDTEAGTARKTFFEKLGAQWIAANISLLVPVGLALYACYVAYTSLMHEFDSIRAERKDIRNERAKIVNALVQQNKNLSSALMDHAKSSVTNNKAIQTLVVDLARERAAGSGDGKDDGKRERVTDRGAGASSGGNTNYNICMAGSDAPKTYTAARFRAAVSKTTVDSLFAPCGQIRR